MSPTPRPPPSVHHASLATLVILQLAIPPASEADPPSQWVQRQTWPVHVAAGIDALGFWPAATHPIVQLGVSMKHLERRRFSIHQPLELGYLVHPNFAHGPSFDTALNLRWRANVGVYLGGGLGLGLQYMRGWTDAYRASDSGFVRTGSGRLSARVLPFVELGYDFSALTPSCLAPFARYQQIIMAPFAPGNGLPVMGRAQIFWGISVPLRSSKRAER